MSCYGHLTLKIYETCFVDARSPVRIVMEWDFDAMCEIEKGNPGQVIELFDMKTGLRASLDSVERLLDGV